MKLLMHDASGIGLAATQVGVLQRALRLPAGRGRASSRVVNPEIVERSEETEVADEGCLSIQGITVPVERSLEVTIVGQDENGEDVRYELEDYAARCVQHETDHLDGVLMIDRTTPEARREALGMLRPRIVLTYVARIAVAATAPFGADVLERLAAASTRSRCCSRAPTSRAAAAASCSRRPRRQSPSGSGSRSRSPRGSTRRRASRPTRSSSPRTGC